MMKRWLQAYPLSTRLGIYLLVPGLLLATFAYFYVIKSMGVRYGQLNVPDLSHSVTIRYDENLVPLIQSTKDSAVFFALGFAHAQNRLWQMEMNRRIAAGRLSEVVGAQGLQSDQLMRVMRLAPNAQKIWDQLPEPERQVLSDYVKGVNAGITSLAVLPPEFLIYNYSPEPWTAIDSLLWMQLLTWQLSSNMGDELRRAALLPLFGTPKTRQLIRVNNPGAPEQAVVQFNNNDMFVSSHFSPKPFIGSNSWVVAGRFTQSGLPLLANDPHLNLTQPSIFYLAELKGDRLNVKGATFPGLPFVAIGHNEHIAWGLTNMMADTQDIFIEQTNPADMNQYRYDDQYLDMEIHEELIQVKEQWLKPKVEPVKLLVRRTLHGPVISDLAATANSPTYALRWTGDDENGGSFRSFLALNYARNWPEFTSALAHFVAPVHNFMYADNQGNIGRYTPGLIPIRTGGGELPRQGWLKESDWQDWIPFEALPHAFNPEQGWLVAANNNFLEADYPHYITADWAPDYRAKRIEQMIKNALEHNKSGLTHADFISLQQDTYLNAAPGTLQFIRRLFASNAAQLDGLPELKNGNWSLSADSANAALIAAWQAQFTRLLLEDDAASAPNFSAAKAVLTQMQGEENQPLIDRILADESSEWCDYRLSLATETCEELAQIALSHALDELNKRFDDEQSQWQWSHIHRAQLAHMPFSHARYLNSFTAKGDNIFSFLFHRSIASAGNGQTVDVGPVAYDKARRFEQLVGSVYRQIVDLGALDQTLFSSATGQSGHPLSQHYDDLMTVHFNNHYVLIKSEPKSAVLTLNPAMQRTGE